MMRRWLAAALLLLPLALAQQPAGGSRWALQYFYDQEGKDLHITDLAFPSDKRGIAVGAIIDREGRIVAKHVGETDLKVIETEIRDGLAGNK